MIPMTGGRAGKLIVVEGIDGAGKSTQVRRLAKLLLERGYSVVTSREPTDGPWGRKLRESASSGRMTIDDELHAFLEDRREHVATLIAPALERGDVVLLDRYYFSTMAYQGIRGADVAGIRAANETFAPRPDLVLLLDFDPRTAIKRISESRGDVPNEFEKLENLEAIRRIFLETAQGDATFRIVDGNGTPDEVFERLSAAALSLLLPREGGGGPDEGRTAVG
ncbi:MAG: dTMP kinase [Planctomycetaceae bacterium]|nr:dTMP kinase [Planctomycetaceae bacterium]